MSKYDQHYREHELLFGEKPVSIVENIPKYINSGKVLELGAGEGRNSLFLASQGFDVKAQDLSSKGIEKLNRLAQERGLKVDTVVEDAVGIEISEDYDALVTTYMLHHLSREDALELIAKIQTHTRPQGLNAVATIMKDGDFYRNNPDTPKFYPDKDELIRLYDGWDILEYDEVERKALVNRPDGTPMLNMAARLLARKK